MPKFHDFHKCVHNKTNILIRKEQITFRSENIKSSLLEMMIMVMIKKFKMMMGQQHILTDQIHRA